MLDWVQQYVVKALSSIPLLVTRNGTTWFSIGVVFASSFLSTLFERPINLNLLRNRPREVSATIVLNLLSNVSNWNIVG